jgi:hypothetical protein
MLANPRCVTGLDLFQGFVRNLSAHTFNPIALTVDRVYDSNVSVVMGTQIIKIRKAYWRPMSFLNTGHDHGLAF